MRHRDGENWKAGVLYPLLVAMLLAVLVAACTPTATPAGPDAAIGSGSPIPLQGTEWLLVSLRDKSPVAATTISLAFYEEDYLEGSAGCNSYGIDYVTTGDEFRVPEIHRTSLACDVPESVMQQEAAYYEALASVAAYRATEDRLELDDASGTTILAYTRKLPPTVDPALQGTEWTLIQLRGQGLLQGSHIELSFGPEGLGGFAGCNRYGGEYEAADGGSLKLTEIAITERDCPSPEGVLVQEDAYVKALHSAAGYRLADGRLEIQDGTGETILVYTRQEEFTMDPTALVGTVWQLVSMDAQVPVEGSTLTLAFHNEGLASGHAGCRDYVITYTANGADLGFIFTAMMGAVCPDDLLMEQEGAFTTMLGWTARFRLNEGELELTTIRGETLLFEPLPQESQASLEGPTWSLLAFVEPNPFDESPTPSPMPDGLLPGTEITAVFEGDAAHGSAGCNSYSATYSTDDSSLALEGITFTEMGCLSPEGVMEQEQRYLGMLRDVVSYHLYGDELWLETDDERALVFTAMPSRSSTPARTPNPTALAISPHFGHDGLLFLGSADGQVIALEATALRANP